MIKMRPVNVGLGQGYGDDGKKTTNSLSVGIGISEGFSSSKSKVSGGGSKGETIFKKVTE